MGVKSPSAMRRDASIMRFKGANTCRAITMAEIDDQENDEEQERDGYAPRHHEHGVDGLAFLGPKLLCDGDHLRAVHPQLRFDIGMSAKLDFAFRRLPSSSS